MQDQLLTALLSAYEGKLDVADPDLLQKASLLAQLSDAAYGSFASFAAPVIAKKQTFAAVPGQMQNFKPVFDTHLSKLNSTYTESGQQYGIWEVAGLGVVVAFQGCRTPLDKLAQLSCKPCSLDNQSQIQLHEGICQAVTPCCKELAQACVKLCSSSTAAEQESLFNTDLRLALAHGGVFTFGAPHVMYSSTSTSNEVAQVLAQCLGGSRFIAVGNTYLLLGNHIKISTKNRLDQDFSTYISSNKQQR